MAFLKCKNERRLCARQPNVNEYTELKEMFAGKREVICSFLIRHGQHSKNKNYVGRLMRGIYIPIKHTTLNSVFNLSLVFKNWSK